MELRAFLVLPLIFLGAAAASSDCGQTPGASVAPAVDRSHLGESTATDGYAAIHMPDATSTCDAALPSVGSPASLRNADDDVMHGLAGSDALAPITQQRQAPLFR